MIVLSEVDKIFNAGKANEVIALKNIHLRINKGEFVVLVGSNGSGKTTLLNLIAGTTYPSHGHIFIDQVNVTNLPDHERSKWITRVFQNPLSGTAADLSILDNFRLAALRTQAKKIKIGVDRSFEQQVKERIGILGMSLEHKIHQAMSTLSGGQRQALTLLMSVMDRVKIILLDEPAAALDPKSARLIMNITNQLIQSEQLTALLVTHDLEDALLYGNRIIQLSEGAIVRDMDTSAKALLKPMDIYYWFI